jgi:hypothetical protein
MMEKIILGKAKTEASCFTIVKAKTAPILGCRDDGLEVKRAKEASLALGV